MVVNLSIDGEDEISIPALQRLLTGYGIYDGETLMSEHGPIVAVNSRPIGASVAQLTRLFQRLRTQAIAISVNVKDAYYSTHKAIIKQDLHKGISFPIAQPLGAQTEMV